MNSDNVCFSRVGRKKAIKMKRATKPKFPSINTIQGRNTINTTKVSTGVNERITEEPLSITDI